MSTVYVTYHKWISVRDFGIYRICKNASNNVFADISISRDGSRISGKGVHMFKSVGVRLLILSLF